eukprot:318045_1
MSENEKEFKAARKMLLAKHYREKRNLKKKYKTKEKKLERKFKHSVKEKPKRVTYNCYSCGKTVFEDKQHQHESGAEHLFNDFGAAFLGCQPCLMEFESEEELRQHKESAKHVECVAKQKDLPNNNSCYRKHKKVVEKVYSVTSSSSE